VKLGLAIQDMQRAVHHAKLAERLGFDFVLTGEHVFFHGPTPNSFVALAAAAGATERIQLLSAVALAPLYPSALLAKMACTLDVVSGGRFNLGVGVGGEYAAEFDAVGVRTSERGQRIGEALQVCRALFTGDPVSFEGNWASIRNQRLDPPPTRPGGPPIWTAGRTERALLRAGTHADVWMPYMITPARLERGIIAAREYAVQAGRDTDDLGCALFAFISVDEDGDRARQWAADIVGANYRQDFSTLSKYLICGTPDECIEQLRRYEASGASSAQLALAVPAENWDASVDLLAAEVLPAVRDPASAMVATPVPST
jgi:probable F420-dependent oxidoreductase